MTPETFLAWSGAVLAVIGTAWTLYQEIRHKLNHGTHRPKKKEVLQELPEKEIEHLLHILKDAISKLENKLKND